MSLFKTKQQKKATHIPESYAARSEIGLVRGHNEDNYIAASPLFVVADGMGGHEAGEVASAIAIEVMQTQVPSRADADALAQSVCNANTAVIEGAANGRGKPGMGTTITAAAIFGDELIIAQVGDSRAYLLHDGSLQRLTRDHSLVAEYVAQGRITEEEARYHPQRSVITRALGSDPNMRADTYSMHISTGDKLMLCSDGLYSMVEDALIEQIMQSSPDTQNCCDALVEAALAAGGLDNVTVIVVDPFAPKPSSSKGTANDSNGEHHAANEGADDGGGDIADGDKGGDSGSNDGEHYAGVAAATGLAGATGVAALAGNSNAGKHSIKTDDKGAASGASGAGAASGAGVAGGAAATNDGGGAASADAASAGATNNKRTNNIGANNNSAEITQTIPKVDSVAQQEQQENGAHSAHNANNIQTAQSTQASQDDVQEDAQDDSGVRQENEKEKRAAKKEAARNQKEAARAQKEAAKNQKRAEKKQKHRSKGPIIGIVCVLLVLVAAVFGIYAYAQNSYYLISEDDKIVLYKGLPGQVGPFSLTWLEEKTDISANELPANTASRLKEGISVSSRSEAQSLLDTYKENVDEAKASKLKAQEEAKKQQEEAAKKAEEQKQQEQAAQDQANQQQPA